MTKETAEIEETASSPYLADLQSELKKMSDKDQKKLLDKLKKNFEGGIKARQTFEQQWYMNLAFYFGKQNVQFLTSRAATVQGANLLYEPPTPKWKTRLIANKIQPMVRNELTKLTKEEPQFFVIPASTEEPDMAAARAGENIAEYLLAEGKFNAERRKATLWACLTGNGFFKCHWDPSGTDSSGTPGVIKAESVNPFYIVVPNLQEEEMEAQPWVSHATCRSVEYVESFFGIEDIEADSSTGAGTFEQRLQTILSVQKNDVKDQVFVREMWIKPCEDFESGAVVWFCDNRLLGIYSGWPYIHGRFPFIKIDHIPAPGRFYSTCSVEAVIPLQREYNKTRSQILENKNRMSKPQLLAPRGSVDPRKITSEPGLVIEFQPGLGAPQPLPLQNLPAYVISEQDRILRDMDDLSGQYEITKGRTPPGVEAASAIAYLQEENDSRLHHTVSSIEEAVTEVGKQLLALVGQFWEEERLVKVVSKNGLYEAKKFKSSDLGGNYDFRIESGSMAPRSRAARQAFITDLISRQIISPQVGLKYLQMSETNRMWMELQLDSRQAQRENDKMATAVPQIIDPRQADPSQLPVGENGVPIYPEPTQPLLPLPLNDYDDDHVHDLEHGNYMKTQEYEMLPPENKQIILAHWQQHRQRILGQQQQMQMQQMAAQGSN